MCGGLMMSGVVWAVSSGLYGKCSANKQETCQQCEIEDRMDYTFHIHAGLV
ncbi:MAG: hypothetical protein NPIRA02_21640 [Nitrospirales bacterium]|nr:MAG: hypothetical protein NPIRA02_21640 [Nitrospirales bacterium]